MNGNPFIAPNVESCSNQDVMQRVLMSRTHSSGSCQMKCAQQLNRKAEIQASVDDNHPPSYKRMCIEQNPTDSSASLPTTQQAQTRIDTFSAIQLDCREVAPDVYLRQRRLVHQRKYRQKQQERRAKLEIDVQKLQQEIVSIELQLQYASVGISEAQTLWSTTINYFRMFRRGCQAHTDTMQTCLLKVLESYMTPNVSDDPVCGIKEILARWIALSLSFDKIYVDLQRLENGSGGNSVVATVETSITVSMRSLRLVFPHLILEREANGTSQKVPSLAEKLLGQTLVVQGTVVLEWDSTMCRVSKMMSQSDVLTPLLGVLGNLEDVSRVFQGALLTPDSVWPLALN